MTLIRSEQLIYLHIFQINTAHINFLFSKYRSYKLSNFLSSNPKKSICFHKNIKHAAVFNKKYFLSIKAVY